ncbi:MAG: hypothetical protein V8R85_09900 [Frisingicoccus sp.]
MDKILVNNEIKAMISAFGTGIHEEFEIMQNLRYHKIITMTDADVDGTGVKETFIINLLLSFYA